MWKMKPDKFSSSWILVTFSKIKNFDKVTFISNYFKSIEIIELSGQLYPPFWIRVSGMYV